MKSYGDTSFPLYLPPISKLLGVSPAPQQLSEPSRVSHETVMIRLRDHTWGPVMSVLQNFFLGIAGKIILPSPLRWQHMVLPLRSSE